jgi:hypothetical protein
MRQFVWSLIFAIGLLFLFAQVAMPILQRPQTVYRLPVHKTLYIARNIPDEEMAYILEAALEWNTVSNGEITFDLRRMPVKNMSPGDSIVILNVTPDYPDIIISDNINKSQTLGLHNSQVGLEYIVLVPARLEKEHITEVVLHELGHALGMKHIEGIDGIGCLMYPNIDEGCDHITNTDLTYLCQLYHCDASKFHELPEIQQNVSFPFLPRGHQ